jgi:hypothetical protein
MIGKGRLGGARTVAITALGLTAVVVGAIVVGYRPDWEAIGLLLFGWIAFLWQNLPRVTVNPAGVITGLVVVALLTGLLDYLARWWCRVAAASPDAPPRRWRFRWSLSLVVTVCVMFAAGLSAIGAARQIGWLVSSDEPLHGWRLGHSLSTSEQTLRFLSPGLHAYQHIHRQLPADGTLDDRGVPLHSWETAILPYLNYDTGSIHLELPWNHPDNVNNFRHPLPNFVNPDFRTVDLYDEGGFGLSHYAANNRVLYTNSKVRFEDITDGLAETILVGEVNAGFQPWGKPGNGRDPAAGIGTRPDQFGGPPGRRGAQFVMADGSVRFLRQDTDPQVLKTLATPAAGDRR